MARSRREMFQQLGGGPVPYQRQNAAGEPLVRSSGEPDMGLRFPYADLTSRAERVAATMNMAHSLETAPAHTVESGKVWYPKVHDAVSKGVRGGWLGAQADPHLAGSGLVAAVSPNMDWERSNIHALGEMRTMSSRQWSTIMHGSEDEAKAVVRGMSISRAPVGNLRKAARIVQGESPTDVITSPKAASFMWNIHEPSNPNYVTIDGRAFDTLTNRLRPWETKRGIETWGAGNARGGDTRYDRSVSVVRDVASQAGLDPSQAQAISWEHMKHLELAGGVRKKGPARVGQPYFHPETGAPMEVPTPRRR